MADYNWSSPVSVGAEYQPLQEINLALSSPDSGYALRIRPGAVTPAAIHRFYNDVPMSNNPGIALEIVDTLMPTTSVSTYLPGADPTANPPGWSDQSGATATLYARVDDKTDTSDYIRNSSAINTWEQRSISFRGTQAVLSGKRIQGVIMGAMMQCVSYSNPLSYGIFYEAFLTIGGTTYYGPKTVLVNNAQVVTPMIGVWARNPATNLPWTQAEVNNIFATGGTDSYGIRFSYPAPYPIVATGLRVFGIWGDIVNVPENRVGGYYYSANKQLNGWNRFALTSPGALSANTWYWLVEYPLNGGTGNFNRSVIHVDPNVVKASSASGSTGEHRSIVYTGHTYGVVNKVFPDGRTQNGSAVTEGLTGGMVPFLLEQAASAINTQSNPYVVLERLKIASDSTPNIGQYITNPASTPTFTGVRLACGFSNPSVAPDQPLVVELRHGAGAANGGGTLDATGYLWPADVTGQLTQVTIPFDASYVSLSATQYFVLIKSSANTNMAWDIVRMDTRSDKIDALSATTVANVEGASQGGQTDGYSANNVTANRYDIMCSLTSLPTTPSGFTATVGAAA